MTRDDVARTGARTAAEALATRPGVWVDRSFGKAGVSLQNLGPEYTLILVDGQRQVGRVDGILDLDRVTTTGLDRIEIVRGAGSALYGSDALGGIVNLITREPSERFAEIGVRHDSLATTDVTARIGDGRRRLRWSLGGGLATGEGYDLDPGDVATTASAFDEARIDGRVAYVPGDDGRRIGVTADYVQRDQRGVDAAATGAIFDNRSLNETGSVRVSARWPIGEETIVRGALAGTEFRDQFLNDQRRSDALDTYEESIDRAAEANAQVERRIGERNLITAGADGLAEDLRSPRLADGDGGRGRAAAFVQDELRLGKAFDLLVVPAFRIDADSQFGVHATPKLGARWDVTDGVAVRGSWGWGYRAPDFKQLYLRFENPGVGYVIEGNPDLGPETSQSFGAGADVTAGAARITIDAYRTDLTDMIGFVLDDPNMMPQRFTYANIASAHVQGVDLGARYQRGAAYAHAAYSLSFTRDEDLDRPLDGRPRHRGALEVGYRDDAGFSALARIVATGSRPFYFDQDGDDMDDEVRTDALSIVGVRVAKRLALAGADDRRATTLYLGAENVLDAGDVTFDPIPPRTLYAGVEARVW
jgi:outer membrane receptor for ferrienterochelin and colicins